jgi:hypothetical protein
MRGREGKAAGRERENTGSGSSDPEGGHRRATADRQQADANAVYYGWVGLIFPWHQGVCFDLPMFFSA